MITQTVKKLNYLIDAHGFQYVLHEVEEYEWRKNNKFPRKHLLFGLGVNGELVKKFREIYGTDKNLLSRRR